MPQKVKQTISDEINQYLLPILGSQFRFIKPQNWHITVVFLGEQQAASLTFLQTIMQETVLRLQPIKIDITGIKYGPSNRNPRMIWLTAKGEQLQKAYNLLHKELKKAGLLPQNNTPRPFTGHITLSRFKKFFQPLPHIEKHFNISFTAWSLDLMKSTLNTYGEREYHKMFSATIKNEN